MRNAQRTDLIIYNSDMSSTNINVLTQTSLLMGGEPRFMGGGKVFDLYFLSSPVPCSKHSFCSGGLNIVASHTDATNI
jgi:hypothetical protein